MLRPAGPQRRRQDDDGGNPRRSERAECGRRRGAGHALGARRARAAAEARRLAAGDAPAGQADGGGEPAHVPLLLSARAPARRSPRVGRPCRQARIVDGASLRRAETAPRRRLRAGQRPGIALPRRADHRPGSAVAAAAVGRRPRVPFPREDGAAHHPLHGRGGAALRPGRHRRQGEGDRARHAAGTDRFAWRPAGGRISHRAAGGTRRMGRDSLGAERPPQRRRRRAHRGATPRRVACHPRPRGAPRADAALHAPCDARGCLRPPDRKVPARVNAPTAGLKPTSISPALWELTLARLRLFFREPGAVFWTFGFPLLLSIALGIAFRNRPAEPAPVAVASAELDRALRSDPQLRPRILDGAAAREALRTGNVDLVVLPGPPISYLYDPARPR